LKVRYLKKRCPSTNSSSMTFNGIHIMEFKHKSVLLDECIENLNIKPDGIYVDGTIGGAGHSEEICKRLSEEGVLIGIDRDIEALEEAKKRLADYKCKKYFIHDNYSNIKEILRELDIDKVDGVLLDLGVSSYQLDNPDRGFSYMQDAPLDMRMNAEEDFTAEDVVNEYSVGELTDIIKDYGEERWAKRIASFIERERKKERITTTGKLVQIIKEAVPASARREGPHPAKRTFQAIRIEVNDELGGLKKAVDEIIDILSQNGRLCIISFHSLEDRIVKEAFARRENPCTCPKGAPVCTCGKVPDGRRVTRKPICPLGSEQVENPRARSAKLRVLEKTV